MQFRRFMGISGRIRFQTPLLLQTTSNTQCGLVGSSRSRSRLEAHPLQVPNRKYADETRALLLLLLVHKLDGPWVVSRDPSRDITSRLFSSTDYHRRDVLLPAWWRSSASWYQHLALGLEDYFILSYLYLYLSLICTNNEKMSSNRGDTWSMDADVRIIRLRIRLGSYAEGGRGYIGSDCELIW